MALENVDMLTLGDSRPAGGNNNGSVPFMKFESDKSYMVRPLGEAVRFYKFFIGKGKPSIIVGSQDKEAAAKLLSEKSGEEKKPSERYAMFVIDRADGRIKVMEAGYQVFEKFSIWAKAAQISPGSSAGGDWQIKVTGEGVGGANPRKYIPVFISNKPFSEDEKTMIKKMKAEKKLQLSDIFKETPLNEILEKAYGVTSSTGSSSESNASDSDILF